MAESDSWQEAQERKIIMPSSNIQWFPGHMTKARRQMEENLKKVDFIIEIRDARIPESSRNPLIEELAGNKPRLILLSKKDKADPQLTKDWIRELSSENQEVMAVDLIRENYRKQLVAKSLKLNEKLIEKQKRKGIRPRALRAMVCGIPNVGKSTMINTLAKRKAAQTGDRPGVTKSLQWIRLDSDLELLDTPGVLWPKFEDQEVGIRLAALGSIKDDVVHMDDLAIFCADYLMKNHPEALLKTYGLEKLEETPWETLEAIARKRGWLQRGQVDENRTMRSFIKDIRENRLGKITWEIPASKTEERDSKPGEDLVKNTDHQNDQMNGNDMNKQDDSHADNIVDNNIDNNKEETE
ncbi:ribosome biogenesis GTPase YlqF [Ileibacterium valens]|uniref:ribosome biogenesis GTPase YlqF n=1 Tax=Ileibacterium valens TaxID=1862668 RepID=UPI0030811B58